MSDEPELFEDDETGLGAYADAAAVDQVARHGKKRRPGRPKGSTNRKTADFERWYQAKGFKDPLVAMAQWLTADPVELQSWFIEHERVVIPGAKGKKGRLAVPSLFEIIKEGHDVAHDLAPYLHGKKPAEIAIIDKRLPSLIIDLGTDQLEEGRAIAGLKAMSIGQRPPELEAKKINDLEEEDE